MRMIYLLLAGIFVLFIAIYAAAMAMRKKR